MRDNMPCLTELNLSGAAIVAYEGAEGTNPFILSYPANTMPDYSFYNPSSASAKASLISVKLPAGSTAVGSAAFACCGGLSGSLTLPAGITSIGDEAFAGCSGLSGSLTLPEGVTAIGNAAFYNCSGLNSLTLPAGLADIGSRAFEYCTGLTAVTNLSLTPQNIGSSDVFSNVSVKDIALIVPSPSVDLYKSADVWKDFKSVTGFVQPPAGIESHALSVVKVYPNPTSGAVTIESDGAEVLLYSLQGVLLKRTRGNRLDLSGYPNGVYLLQAGSKATKVIKQ
jgi:hypothetical protein